jgi:hypothetical protein
MSNNEYNNGLKKGYSRSLHILRQIDKDIKYPDMSDAWGEEYLVYNTKKDFMHEIYGAIKDEMEVEYGTIELDFDDEELLKYMKLAHEEGMSFNEWIEHTLTQIIKELK